MSRRTRKMARKTPLSALDNLIYFFAMAVLGFAVPVCIWVYLSFIIPGKIAFSDETVVCSYNKIGMVTPLILMFTLISIFILPINYAYVNRIPLVGNKHFKPNAFERIIPTYPLFSKEFNKNILPDLDKKVKIYTRTSIICLVVSLVIAPLGLCPRISIDSSDTVKNYNVFNMCTDESHWSEVTDLSFDMSRGHRSHIYGIDVYYTLNGKRRELSDSSFRNRNYEERLRYYLHLKDYFDEGEYTVDAEKMDRLLETRDLSSSEIELIYQLFDYTP